MDEMTQSPTVYSPTWFGFVCVYAIVGCLYDDGCHIGQYTCTYVECVFVDSIIADWMDIHDAKTDCDTSTKRARDIASAIVISTGVLCLSTFAFLLLYTFVCSVVLERDKYSCRTLSPNELYSILHEGTRIHTIYSDIKNMWIANNIDMKDACVMLAPYANHHVQLAIAKHDQSYEIIANPTYEVCDSSDMRTVKEDSPLCAIRNVNGKRGRFLVNRHTCIHASYATIDNTYEAKTLHYVDAYCYQHMYDVFNGKMPCDMITKSSMGREELWHIHSADDNNKH